MTIQEIARKNKTEMVLKGGMFTLTSIQLFDNNLDAFSLQLDEKIKQAPKFFQYAPVILDVYHLQTTLQTPDFQALIHLLKSKKLIPIGVKGANDSLKSAAILAGLAIFPEDKIVGQKNRLNDKQPPEESVLSSTSNAHQLTTRVITQPVRSGQQIYVPNGDLIVLASVSPGAEILADGHIHVHGSMRGRALAGVMGNQDSMIFCKSLEAELVSIAGQYRVSDDLKENYWKQTVCIQLQDGHLNIRLA